MFKAIVVLYYVSSIWPNLKCDNCADDREVIIKSTITYPSISLYQDLRSDFTLYRSQYAIKHSVDTNIYADRTYWRLMIDTGQVNDIAYSPLEIQMTVQEQNRYPELIMIPVMTGALTFIYNLPNVAELNVTLDIMNSIYLGEITQWDDPNLQTINPRSSLPKKKIIVAVNKLDVTADTFIFTSTFSSMYPKFDHKFGVATDKWPDESYATLTNQSYNTYFVNATPYSIGYTSLASNVQFTHSLRQRVYTKIATILNNDRLVRYDEEDIVHNAELLFRRSRVNETFQNETSRNPIVYLSYIVYNSTTPPDVSCCAMQEAVGFAEYILTSNSSVIEKFGYYHLPPVMTDYVLRNLLPLITCNNTPAILRYKSYKSRVVELPTQNWKSTVAIAICLLLLLTIVVVVFVVYHKRVVRARETMWLITFADIRIYQDSLSSDSVYSHPSERTTRHGRKRGKKFNCETAVWKSKDLDVFVARIRMGKVSNWKRKTKLLITRFIRDISHPNVDLLLGVTVIQRNPYLVSQYCAKGTLNYFLTTCPYNLNVDVKYCFARDVFHGLKYLHHKNIVHGNLNSINCYVDNTWNVKIFDWAVNSIIENENYKHPPLIGYNSTIDKKAADSVFDETNILITVLYMDSETIRTKRPTKSSDVYSFGMMLIEIFTGNLPYNDEVQLCLTSYPDVIANKMNNVPTEPNVSAYDIPGEVKQTIMKLIRDKDNRPEIAAVANDLESFRIKRNKSVVDVMMETVEKYVEELEETIVERTSDLNQTTARITDLLCDILPPQIAKKFLNGQTIEPEFYEHASIFFSDIVGFTWILARLKPLDVLTLMNDMWQIIDKTLEKFDVYRIDTIGDAYMITSGLPKRNNYNHCRHIADFALTLKTTWDEFVPSKSSDKLVKIRMGINSGSVTAGIVGFKVPRYCVFGDTVNVASRMEISSSPNKIHVSEYFQNLTTQHFPSYKFELRGELEVTGVGMLKTFWLLGAK